MKDSTIGQKKKKKMSGKRLTHLIVDNQSCHTIDDASDADFGCVPPLLPRSILRHTDVQNIIWVVLM